MLNSIKNTSIPERQPENVGTSTHEEVENKKSEPISSIQQEDEIVSEISPVLTPVEVPSILEKEEGEQTVDVSVNIMDTNYQIELLKQFLTSKNYDKHLDAILNHNKMVENKMLETETETAVFKKWFIKNIEFSNFLSYGENQKVDFEKTNGLTVIESNPPNFGGKTVLSVD